MNHFCNQIISQLTIITPIPTVSNQDNSDFTSIMGSSAFDSNKQLRSILTKYSIPITNINNFTWECLTSTNVSRDDLDHLVRVIGLYCENVIVRPTNYNWRHNKYYYCGHCKEFNLPFQCACTMNDTDFYEIVIDRYTKHSASCNRQTTKIPCLGPIIEESPKLISIVRTAGNLYDNKSKIDIQLLKDNLGLQVDNIDGRMLPRVIANLRSKFVDEIPNLYHLLFPFIRLKICDKIIIGLKPIFNAYCKKSILCDVITL